MKYNVKLTAFFIYVGIWFVKKEKKPFLDYLN